MLVQSAIEDKHRNQADGHSCLLLTSSSLVLRSRNGVLSVAENEIARQKGFIRGINDVVHVSKVGLSNPPDCRRFLHLDSVKQSIPPSHWV